jgi:hypothetical protein
MATNETKQVLRANRVAKRRVRQELRRQARLMAQHPENDAIDAWNEVAYD